MNKVSTRPAHLIWHVMREVWHPYQLSEPEHMVLVFKLGLNWMFVSIKIDTKAAWVSWTLCFGSRNMDNRSSKEPWSDLVSSLAEQDFASKNHQTSVSISFQQILIGFIDRHRWRDEKSVWNTENLFGKRHPQCPRLLVLLQNDDNNLTLRLREPVRNFCHWYGGRFVFLEVK